MERIAYIFTLLLLTIHFSINAQVEICEEIMKNPEQAAEFRGGTNGLLTFAREEIVPLISEERITELFILLKINKSGVVSGVTFIRSPIMSDELQDKLRTKLYKMNGWKAASNEGKKFCSYSLIPINCVKYK